MNDRGAKTISKYAEAEQAGNEAYGKGNLPKYNKPYSYYTGTGIEQIRCCHIGNYVEGYQLRGQLIVCAAAVSVGAFYFVEIMEVMNNDKRTK